MPRPSCTCDIGCCCLCTHESVSVVGGVFAEPLQYVQTMLTSTTPTLHPTTSPTSEVSSAPTPEPGPTHQVMFHATIETDSSILDNETLKMAFETEYKEALASKLDISAEFVEVLSMTPGSVIVEVRPTLISSTVNNALLSHCSPLVHGDQRVLWVYGTSRTHNDNNYVDPTFKFKSQ